MKGNKNLNLYKYETHLHTLESSGCATCSGAEQARIYKQLGYSGIIITDHFFNGNTTVPRNLPWEERVERFMLGYENAYSEGIKIGLPVYFGWEESYNGTDFLVYGLDKAWLLSHPEIEHWDIPEHYRRIHDDGGFIVHAHPFREAFYIPEIRLLPEYADAVEVVNASHVNPSYNRKAATFAKKYNKPATGGSDAHHSDSIHGGMVFEQELNNIQEFINTVKNSKSVGEVTEKGLFLRVVNE